MLRFFGVERRKLDSKGRIKLPSKAVKKLGQAPFVVKRYPDLLLLYPEERKKEFRPSQIEEIRTDGYGRICLPFKVANIIGRNRKVVITGEGEHLVIRPRRKLSFSELTLREAESLYLQGLAVAANGDKKEVIIQKN